MPSWNGIEFTSYEPDTAWNDVGGVYIFVRPNNGKWQALYVGQTDSFSRRLSNHEKWAAAARMGATHVHAVSANEADRLAIEADLIGKFQPPLNTQLRQPQMPPQHRPRF